MVLTVLLVPPGFALVEFLFWLVTGLLDSPAAAVTLTEHAGRPGHFITKNNPATLRWPGF